MTFMPFRKTPTKPAVRARDERRARAQIDRMIPEVDGGRFAAKAVIGDDVRVEAHVFTDGHDTVTCMLRYRHESETAWQETPMLLSVKD